MKKFILVTGANGKIGSQIVKSLIDNDYNVLATYNKKKNRISKIISKINTSKNNFIILKFQQSSEIENKKFFNSLKKKKIILVAGINTAVIRPMKKGLNDTFSNWEKSIKINANINYLFTKNMCDYLKKNGGGKVINLGSIYGSVGPDLNIYKNEDFELEPDYVYNKFALIGLTKYFASMYGKYNINVNAISPGGFLEKQSKKFIAKYSKKTFLNRMANYDELDGLVKYLVSDQSSYMTGQNLILDGGFVSN